MSDHATLTDFDCLAANSLGILVDIQEKFVPAITDFSDDAPAMSATQTLLAGTTALDMPWVVSEQVPEKLGATVSSIIEALPKATERYGKTTFSLFDDPGLVTTIADYNRDTLIFCGLEAHVCLLASVDDAVRRGYRVIVASDAIASRQTEHRDIAIATMRQLGALVLPVESVLLRLCREATHPQFRTISRLIR